MNSSGGKVFKEYIEKVTRQEDLDEKESMELMQGILEGNLTPAQLASLIIALKMKGESAVEITGFAKVMKEKSTKVNKIEVDNLIDTCGTGGDEGHTFNISTASALVVSACGIKVAKHGNRAVSSSCGSADILEALGMQLDVNPEKTRECLEKVGFGFLYAPLHHQAMKHATKPRREIGVKTIFNLLGPLTNPAGAKRQLLGVYEEGLTGLMAEVLNNLGTKKAWVVYGLDGIDEITICNKTKVSEVNRGKIKSFYIDPRDYGFEIANPDDIAGGDKGFNSDLILRILYGEKGPCRDVVELNSAAALLVGDKVKTLQEGVKLVRERIDNGIVLQNLKQLKNIMGEAKAL